MVCLGDCPKTFKSLTIISHHGIIQAILLKRRIDKKQKMSY